MLLALAADWLTPTMPPLFTAIGLSLLALAPFLLVGTTSFAKIVVVLSLLRTALGAPNVPPNTVLAALSLVLTALVMLPVAEQVGEASGPLVEALAPAPAGDAAASPVASPSALIAHAASAAEPMRAFLVANAGEAELASLAQLYARQRGANIADVDVQQAPVPWGVAAPAFALSELREAFIIGFLLFLPFLVLDLLIGSILLSFGMHMLTPTTVSMPFKLLLFVGVNGWLVLSESLVLSYVVPGAGL